MNQPECHDHCFVIDPCEGCTRHWSDEELEAWRDYIFKESDLIHAAAQHDKVPAVLRRDVQVQVFHGYFLGEVYWASDLERMWEEGKHNPVWLELCEIIGYKEHLWPEPPWRKIVRQQLAKRDYQTGQFRRILRELGTKDEHGGRDL